MQSKCALAVATTSTAASAPATSTSSAPPPATSSSLAPSPVATSATALFSCVPRLCLACGYGCRNRASIAPE